MRIVSTDGRDWSQMLFDTGIYYEVWEGVNRITAEQTAKEVAGVEKLLEELGVGCGGQILDIGGGYGRIAIPLVEYGEVVHILERSPFHCQLARDRIREAGLCEEQQIFVHNCDCRNIGVGEKALVVQADKADAAINIFTSVLGYYSREDDLAVLRQVHELLKSDAPLVIDTINLYWIVRNFRPDGVDWANDRSWVQTEQRRFRPSFPGVYSDFTFVHFGRDEMYNFEMVHRMYDQASLAILLQAAGFSPFEFYGSWDFEPLVMDSKRLICVARKS
jgi:SAM-dependent methyltransferase